MHTDSHPVTAHPLDARMAIAQAAKSYWHQARPYQRLYYWIAFLLIASGIFHIIPLILSGGELSGPVSFRKPIVFGLSGGVTILSTTWVMTFLPKRHRWGAVLNGILSSMLAGEIFLISLQTWRGVPSHFNFSTPLDTAIFGAMGGMVNLIALAILVLTVLTFSRMQAPASLVWAIRIGMLFLLLSQGFGQLIIANGFAKVIDPQTGEFLGIQPGPASPNVRGLAGLMKLPHFFTLHGIQFLPGLALLLGSRRFTERRRTWLLLVAAAGYAGLVAVVTLQVFRGLATFDLDPAGWMLLIISVITWAMPAALALANRTGAGPRQTLRSTESRPVTVGRDLGMDV